MERLYKVLGEDGRACNGGTGAWPVPVNGTPGEWLSVEGPLRPCEHGLHLCRRQDLVEWLGPVIWRAEAAPDAAREDCDNKVVVARARLVARVTTWTDRSARLFAADCAERALARERAAEREPDARSWAAIQAARDFAEGRISAAAEAAARAAAWAAAEAAAEAAAWAAARAAERGWQTERLWWYLDGEVIP